MTDAPLRMCYGTFDGQNMRGDDGRVYTVPANYASKSKLVEGDKLKMILTENGIFFKQIESVKRRTFIGKVVALESGTLIQDNHSNLYEVITASVTYYGLKAGDEVIAHVPLEGDARFATIESIISQAA